MDDLISRQAAIDAIEKLILPQVKGETAAEEINRVAWRCAINCAEEMIGHLPSAEWLGRWEFNIDDEGWSWDYPYMCDQCGEWAEKEFNFCPNCGARMEV